MATVCAKVVDIVNAFKGMPAPYVNRKAVKCMEGNVQVQQFKRVQDTDSVTELLVSVHVLAISRLQIAMSLLGICAQEELTMNFVLVMVFALLKTTVLIH